MADERVVLRSPFNGGTLVVPPDFPPETLEYMLEHAGYTRVDERHEPKKSKRDKPEE